MDNLKLAVAGLGSIAEYHLEAFSKLPGVEIACVMSRNPETVERTRQKYRIAGGFTDFDRMLEQGGADAVILCTPNQTHFAMAEKVLRHDKHVLVEKPLASTSEEVRELRDLAAGRARNIMAAMTARFTPQYLEAARIIRNGGIGEIIQIAVRWFEPKKIGINWEKKPVQIDPKTSTVLYHHGSHMLDAAFWLMADTMAEIQVAGARHQVLNDDVAILVKTRGGKFITCVHSFNAQCKLHDLTIIGTEGTIEIKSYEELRVNGNLTVSIPWERSFRLAVEAQAAEFAASIRNRRKPLAAADELLESFMTLEAAYSQLVTSGAA